MDKDDTCYLLTVDDGIQINIYSLREDGGEREVLIFQNYDDAQRYAIMLEQDEEYLVGESIEMDITSVNLGEAVDILNQKECNYILVKEDDLFIPPHANWYAYL